MADQQCYQEAERIKRVSDALEEKEKANMNSNVGSSLKRREQKLRKQQHDAMENLLKRIKTKRRDYEHQRKVDCGRLLQRNKNIQALMDSKHVSLPSFITVLFMFGIQFMFYELFVHLCFAFTTIDKKGIRMFGVGFED